MKRLRLDEKLVRAGLAPTRRQAEVLIRTGHVLVDNRPIEKPGTQVREEAEIRVRGQFSRFVSRGGDKLVDALEQLAIDPRGKSCLDIGASTGGFSDCLLQNGAKKVTGVDVGYGQLHPKLRNDVRVRILERTNARTLEAEDVPDRIDIVTIDVSFISATLILPAVMKVAPLAEVLVLVKPQFEVGRNRVGKGGVVRDDGLRKQALLRVRQVAERLGYRSRGFIDCALPGPKGNREIFLHLEPVSSGKPNVP